MANRPKIISFLITHYNRPKDLLKCLEAMRLLELDDYEIVVSDDASSQEVLNTIRAYPLDTLVETSRNEGLASNINRGLKACKGSYVIYCQEDFLITAGFKDILPSLLSNIDNGTADMVRLTAYFRFNKLYKIDDDLSLIPRFSFSNFFQNYYRYSDHPYIVKRSFYDTYGYYLNNTSGGYGESEYGVRLSRSSVKIAITNVFYAKGILESNSVMMLEKGRVDVSKKYNKKLVKLLRAFRLYLEWILYKKEKRGLVTYKNERNT